MTWRIVLVSLSILVVSCNNQLAPENELAVSNKTISVKTDSSGYFFNGFVTQVVFIIRNNSDSTATFSHCAEKYAYYLERSENGQWIDKGGWGIVCEADFSSGIKKLLPDSTYSDVAQVTERGTYRLVFPYSLRLGTTLTDSLVSNAFQVQ